MSKEEAFPKSDVRIESVELKETIPQTKIEITELKYTLNEGYEQKIKAPPNEIGYFFLEGKISALEKCDCIIIPDMIINPGVKPNNDRSAIYILHQNGGLTPYWFTNNKFIPHAIPKENQVKLKKLIDGSKIIKSSSKVFKKVTSLCGYIPKVERHLLCTIKPITGAFNLICFEKLQDIINTNQSSQYIKHIQINLQKKTIEIEFLQLNSLDFYLNLIKLIEQLLSYNFRELTKFSNIFENKKPESKKYERWMNQIMDIEKKTFSTVIRTNQKTTQDKRYVSLVEIDKNTLEYQTFAQANSLKHVKSNSSLSDYSAPSLNDSKQKVVLNFGLKNLPQQEDEKPSFFQEPSKNLVILALGSLDSIESFFRLLIKLRLLEMNILISVLKNTEEVIRVKQKTFLNREITFTESSVGALATLNTADAYAIGYNATYLRDLLILLCFKPFLIKQTDNLLIYYAISDKTIKISPPHKSIDHKRTSSSRFLRNKSSQNNIKQGTESPTKGTLLELR